MAGSKGAMPPRKAGRKFDADRAAAILVDSELRGASHAMKAWGVSEATISRYRARLETDPILQDLVRVKKDGVDAPAPIIHAPTVQEVTGNVLAFLQKAALEADHRDPEVIHAVMGGYKVLKEVENAAKSLDAYLSALAAQSGQRPVFQSEGAQQLSSGAASSTN